MTTIESSTKVLGADLIDGSVIYITGRWQRVDHIRQEGGHFRLRTQRSGDHDGVANATSLYDVATCPACGQAITASDDYTECGGIGEGGCEAWVDGDPAAEAAHRAILAVVALGTSV